VEEAVFEAFERFEKDGFTDQDLERLKAGMETGFYSGISSILGKSFQLAQYNEYAGSPDYYKQDIQRMKEVTKADILRVYEKYIKGKPYLATSFVPRGQADLVADGSINAGVVEEDIQTATQVEITDEGDDMDYPRTPSAFDRSVMPTDGPDPEITIPTIWTDQLANGLKIYGIEHTELPLVQFNITIKGGHLLESMDKAGTASLMAQLMNEGTQNKTPQELEEAIELLGAGIRIGAGSTSVNISASCLTRNFEATLALLEEMLLEPRWDEEEFELAKIRTQNGLRRQKASPTSLASEQFQKLVYGEDHIFSVGSSGTEESVAGITIDDLKAFYEQNISPSVASFHIAGKIDKEQVVSALSSINEKWSAREVSFPSYQMPPAPEKSQVWVLDVPGAKQSVIQIGCPGPLRTDPDYFAATVMNDKLGGSFNGWVNLVLREEKGYTYGARTSFSGNEVAGTFTASSQVRSSATLESVEIFRDLMAKYREGLSQEDIDFTRTPS
jgi:zinc protease